MSDFLSKSPNITFTHTTKPDLTFSFDELYDLLLWLKNFRNTDLKDDEDAKAFLQRLKEGKQE